MHASSPVSSTTSSSAAAQKKLSAASDRRHASTQPPTPTPRRRRQAMVTSSNPAQQLDQEFMQRAYEMNERRIRHLEQVVQKLSNEVEQRPSSTTAPSRKKHSASKSRG